MLIKIHKSYRDVVSICDSDLLGKFFEENEFQLDVKESFYNGEEKTEEEVSEIIQDLSREDATFNIVGEKFIMKKLHSTFQIIIVYDDAKVDFGGTKGY